LEQLKLSKQAMGRRKEEEARGAKRQTMAWREPRITVQADRRGQISVDIFPSHDGHGDTAQVSANCRQVPRSSVLGE
jgi:hypothetical protein